MTDERLAELEGRLDVLQRDVTTLQERAEFADECWQMLLQHVFGTDKVDDVIMESLAELLDSTNVDPELREKVLAMLTANGIELGKETQHA